MACEEMNFVWDSKEVANFRSMWNEGKGIKEISSILKRDPDEVLILAIDQSKHGYISRRSNGLNQV